MNRDVEALKLELLALEAEFGKKMAKLKIKIAQVEHHQPNTDSTFREIETSSYVETKPLSESPLTSKPSPVNPSHPEQVLHAAKVPKTAKVQTPPYSLELLGKLSIFIFSCFNDWFSPVARIVTSYKDRGLLPVFVLTILGIALVLSGFGYWMQLVIESMAASQKSMLMGLLSVAVIGVGGVLKRKSRFSEFATAIVALGILLGYSTIHFVGNVYQLISPQMALIGYLVVTVAAHLLAWRFDTKILVTIGIVGIAVMPVISSVSMRWSDLYLASLLLSIVSGLWFAYKRDFFWLAPLALGFLVLAIEWSAVRGSVSAWLVNLSYVIYLCFYMANVQNQRNLSKNLKLLLAVVGAHIALMLQIEGIDSAALLTCMLINAALSGCAFAYSVKYQLASKSSQILLVGVWLALAIILALNADFWGLAWCAEGLLLVALSKKLNTKSALYQGQGLLLIGLLFSTIAVAPYFPSPALTRVDGWTLVLSILLSMRLWALAISKEYVYVDDFTCKRLLPLIYTVEPILFATVIIASGYLVIGYWVGALVILIQGVLLFRADQLKLLAIDTFSLSLAVIPLFIIGLGAESVGSVRFSELPAFAKVATITSFLQLWLWSEFYRRFAPDNKLIPVAEKLRIGFYALIPVCWLSSSFHHFNDDVIVLLWMSPLLAFFLFANVKHKFLEFEAKLLLVISSLVWGVSSVFATSSAVFIGFVGFSLMFMLVYRMAQKHKLHHQAEYVFTTALVSIGITLPILVMKLSAGDEIAFQVFALYWLSCFTWVRKAKLLWRNERLITVMCFIALLLSWRLTLEDLHYIIISFYFAMACLIRHSRKTYHKAWLAKCFKPYNSLFLHTLALVSYIAWLIGAELSIMIGPMLAVHAIGILLLSKLRLMEVRFAFILIFAGVLKIAFVDAVASSQGEKVMLFVGVGAVILCASFWYQKLLSKLSV